jgi:hypothetical protein
MSRPKRTSALAGMILVLTLAVTPAAQAAGPGLSFPASWLEIGLDRLAGWWHEVTTPRRVPAVGHFDTKISTSIDPNGDHSPAPPPPNSSRDISAGIDPNGKDSPAQEP